MADPAVVVFDTTLRDGEQAPGFSMRVEEKLQLARQLDALGVDIMEAGFPIASQDDAEAVRRVSSEVRRPVIAALARCAPGDIDAAGKALAPAARSRIHTFIATSDLHLERKLRITREQCLERAVDAVKRARGFTDDVQFSAEDATRSDVGFLYQIVDGDPPHRLGVVLGGDREAGLHDVHAQGVELTGQLDLLLDAHREAWRLLSVAEGGVEHDDRRVGHVR